MLKLDIRRLEKSNLFTSKTSTQIQNSGNFVCNLCNHIVQTSHQLVHHLKSKHKHTISVEEYFEKFIDFESFQNFKSNKLNKKCSEFLQFRLTKKCAECGLRNCTFEGFTLGFTPFCSHACSNNHQRLNQIRSNNQRETIKNKYGVDWVSHVPEFVQKAARTNKNKSKKEKEEILNKIKKTNIEKYGTDHFVKTLEYKEKSRKTIMERYGTECTSGLPHVKKKSQDTCIERYGVPYSAQSAVVREKYKNTCLTRYGVDTTLNLPSVRAKSREAHQEKFNQKLEKFNFLHVDLIDAKNRLFRCLECNSNFHFIDDITLSYSGPRRFPHCTRCKPIGKAPRNSLIQQELGAFLKTLSNDGKNFTVLCDVPGILDPETKHELDFFIPEFGIAFELNGLYYHSEFNGRKKKNYHINKTEKCESQNIRLIQIFEDEWVNRKTVVLSKISYILKSTSQSTKYGARTCEIKQIPRNESNQFLDKFHIQGGENSSNIRYGAFYRGSIVAVMTFSPIRIFANNTKNKRHGHYELVRFCSSDVIPGIGSKLFSTFIKDHQPEHVISYADRRWSTPMCDTVYQKMGFEIESTSAPTYWYLLNHEGYKIRHHRFGFRKSILKNTLKNYDPKLTEWENMLNNRHDRIWDCGRIKFVWNKNGNRTT